MYWCIQLLLLMLFLIFSSSSSRFSFWQTSGGRFRFHRDMFRPDTAVVFFRRRQTCPYQLFLWQICQICPPSDALWIFTISGSLLQSRTASEEEDGSVQSKHVKVKNEISRLMSFKKKNWTNHSEEDRMNLFGLCILLDIFQNAERFTWRKILIKMSPKNRTFTFKAGKNT